MQTVRAIESTEKIEPGVAPARRGRGGYSPPAGEKSSPAPPPSSRNFKVEILFLSQTEFLAEVVYLEISGPTGPVLPSL